MRTRSLPGPCNRRSRPSRRLRRNRPRPTLVLPGRLDAYVDAPIYARVPGYLHAWYADIGAHVKAGQLLASIDTPDLDQQLQQARADLQSASANERLAAVTAARWAEMLAQDSVSQQEADETQRPRRETRGRRGEHRQRATARSARIVQAAHRAVRRHRDGTQDRCRRADRRGQRQRRRSSPSRTRGGCGCTSTFRKTTRPRSAQACVSR